MSITTLYTMSLAFSKYDDLRLLIFTWLISMYVLCVLGNTLVTIVVCLSPRLHTTMYFFLCHLTVLDIIYINSFLPKLLVITITGDTRISYTGCFAQVFLFFFCIGTEFYILVCMSYDRYVAICIPLHYTLIMKKKTCLSLSVFCFSLGIFNAMLYTLLISKLSFSQYMEINHVFCHMKSMLQLSCSDTTSIDLLILIDGILLGYFLFILILISYMFIISKILKVKTTSGRLKTFSSCSSHLTVVVLFGSTSLILNMKSETKMSQEQDKLFSMLYIAVVPTMNPLVYSLRNKDVIRALKKNFLKIKQNVES